MATVGIDVKTRDAKALVQLINSKLQGAEAHLGGVYREDAHYRQVFVEGAVTEKEVDEWLYKHAGHVDYVGTWEMKDEPA